MLQNEGNNVLTSDQTEPWPLAFEREGVAAVSSKGHEHDEFAGALDTDELLHFRRADGGGLVLALDLDQRWFDAQGIFVGDDIDAAVLGVRGDARLVSQGPQEVGGEFFELAVSNAFLKHFEHEVSRVAFDA